MHNHNHSDIAQSAPRHSGIVEVYDSLARSYIKGWLPSLYINNNANLFGKPSHQFKQYPIPIRETQKKWNTTPPTKSKIKQIQIVQYIN